MRVGIKEQRPQRPHDLSSVWLDEGGRRADERGQQRRRALAAAGRSRVAELSEEVAEQRAESGLHHRRVARA